MPIPCVDLALYFFNKLRRAYVFDIISGWLHFLFVSLTGGPANENVRHRKNPDAQNKRPCYLAEQSCYWVEFLINADMGTVISRTNESTGGREKANNQ